MEENTKNYAEFYAEETAPVPQIRRSTTKTLDGARTQRRHRELGIGVDPNELSSALYSLSASQYKAFAINTLHTHYTANFRKKESFAVHLNYVKDGTQNDAYLVRGQINSLKELKQKLPIKGKFRYFIKNNGKWEEFEDDHAPLPYVEEGDAKNIYCRVFDTR